MLKHHLVPQHFNQHSHKLKQVEFIYAEIAKRMHERLDYIKIMSARVLDFASDVGIYRKLLQNCYPDELIYK